MAQRQTRGLPKNEIGFQNIELLKNETLGVGSYGYVCMARCDYLLCAAKIIHQTLVPPNALQHISREREHRLPIRMFEMECAFLKEIKHPNIVQYLGMYQDPASGLPVLLMELMNKSLTRFLENSTEPIPYHIQLEICLDISRALSYLHLNGIIHRDLSSNNILLNGKGTAKLADFGMAKLINVHVSHASNTVCPGADVYMPPEAINNQIVYTEKGDVFSLGVNILQILTRKFPMPGVRFKTVTSSDPRVPSLTAGIRVCVSEIERRNNHVSEIPPAHPLLLIALDCLQDQESDRPSAGELCQRLAALKDTPGYLQCGTRQELRQLSRSQKEDHQQDIAARQQEIQVLREELSAAQDIARERNKLQRDQEEVIFQLERRIDEVELNSRPQPHLQSFSSTDIAKATPPLIPSRRQQLSQLPPPPIDTARATPPPVPFRRQHLPPPTETQLPSRDRQRAQRLPPPTGTARATPPPVPARRQRLLPPIRTELPSGDQQRAQRLPPPTGKTRATPPPVSSKGHQSAEQLPLQIASRGYKRTHSLSTCKEEEVVRLNWTHAKKAPRVMRRWTDAVVDGSVVYFNPAGTREVYSYNSVTDIWSQLPDCHAHYSTLAVVNGLLTTVGGSNINQLFSLRERKWTELFPPMPSKRHSAIAVTTGRALIVAGGYGDNGQLRGNITTVEVLNIDSRRWSTAANLPQSMYRASATVCGDRIYMGESNSVITCSLSALLQSCCPKIIEAQPSTPSPRDPVWTTVADHRVRYSSLVSINNHLLAISGSELDYEPTTAVRLYDPVNNSWQTISHLVTSRRLCFAVVLPENRIMVVGGLTSKSLHCETDTVECATSLML